MPPSHEGTLHDFPDRAIREALQRPENLRDLLGVIAPDLADRLDFGRVEVLERQFALEDWRRREADLLYRAPFRGAAGEEPALVCVLLEHQSAPDPRMPLRLLIYMTLLWERQWKDWEEAPPPRDPLRLTPVLPVVFHTGPSPWRGGRELADLIAPPAALRDFAPRWRTLFWSLADQPLPALLDRPGEFLKALAVIRAEVEEAEAFRATFQEVVRRLEGLHGRDRMRWEGLLRLALSWGLFRRPEPEWPALIAAAQASQVNQTVREEIRAMAGTMGQSMAERILSEGLSEGRAQGLAEGRAQGLAEGLAEGRAQGELQATRGILRRLLEQRFGPLPEAIAQRIEAGTDVARLQAEIARAVEIRSLDELQLERPASVTGPRGDGGGG